MQHGTAGLVAKGDVLELDRAVVVFERRCVRRVFHGHGHVQHLEDALARCHGALHDAVLHGECTNRIEEPLNVEQERHHHAELEFGVHDHAAAHDDDHRHGGAGEQIDDRDQHVGELRGPQMCVEVVLRLVAEQHVVDLLAPHLLDGAHAVHVLGQRAVHDRAGFPRAQEHPLGRRQPDQAHDEQRRHHNQRQQPQAQIEPQQHADDAAQQHQIANREDGGLQKLLQRIDVALQARHQSPGFGLVHERQRHFLKMRIHGPAEIEQQVLCHAPYDHLLQDIGQIVDDDDSNEADADQAQHTESVLVSQQGMIDGGAQQQRNHDLGDGEHQHTGDSQEQPTPVRAHERQESSHDDAVERGAEHLFFLRHLRTDDGERRSPGSAAAGYAHAGPSAFAVCSECSAA